MFHGVYCGMLAVTGSALPKKKKRNANAPLLYQPDKSCDRDVADGGSKLWAWIIFYKTAPNHPLFDLLLLSALFT